jgi:5-methylcytosine-specific restriction endonuclease McrA
MNYVLCSLSDEALLRGAGVLAARERGSLAGLLAYIAEIDERRLYLPAACPSMHAWCVRELHLSEDAACRRIEAARVARRFPAIFPALAEGRLHLTGVLLLGRHLTGENSEGLLVAAAHKTNAEIRQVLADRFPRPDVAERIRDVAPAAALLPVGASSTPERTAVSAPARIAPLGAGRYELKVMISEEAHEDLRRAQALLGHTLPSGNVGQVVARALRGLVVALEKQKCGARRAGRRRPTTSRRHIPVHVRQAVWARDGGRCTYVSATGQRCPARTRLEFDHLQEVARGGEATVANLRLRCRGHNQLAAEYTFGAEFMQEKRDQARRARLEAAEEPRTATGPPPAEEERKRAAEAARAKIMAAQQAAERAVATCFRRLGFRADEARRAAAYCDTFPDASLEERVRIGLSFLCPKPPSHGGAARGP